MGVLKCSSDDHVILWNGQKVGHFTKGRIQPDTGANITDIGTAEGSVGNNVGPAARSRPGSGNISMRITSPDLARLAEDSAAGDAGTIVFRVVKNFEAYSYSEVTLASATLGPVPTGPDTEVPEIEVSFRGTGYKMTPKDAS